MVCNQQGQKARRNLTDGRRTVEEVVVVAAASSTLGNKSTCPNTSHMDKEVEKMTVREVEVEAEMESIPGAAGWMCTARGNILGSRVQEEEENEERHLSNNS